MFKLHSLVNSETPWATALCMGIIAAGLFTFLATLNIKGQGLYYDELHQATASFAYIGAKPEMFTIMVGKIPVLNMPYSAAIKSGIYGLYLKAFNTEFTIESWRLLGIIFVVLGILLFSLISRSGLPPLGIFLFFLVFITDITLVLTTRHDWGPVALALLIRLAFVAIILRDHKKLSLSIRNTFILGCLVGLAAFEKLTSLVLIFPFIIILSLQKGTRKHWFAAFQGLVLGTLPLTILNFGSLLNQGFFISLKMVFRNRVFSLSQFLTHWHEYFRLGNGESAQQFIFGHGSILPSYIEILLLSLLLILVLGLNLSFWKRKRKIHLSGVMFICYIAVGTGLYLLPRIPWIHYWIIGTPFQYLAISLAAVSIPNLVAFHARVPPKTIQRIFILLLALFLVSRIIGIVAFEKSLIRGDTSFDWDPSFTDIGYFAAEHSQEAVFIAANWGVATQIYCLSNGKSKLVYEPYWNYQGSGQLIDIIHKSGKKVVYIVAVSYNGPYFERTQQIQKDMENLPGWEERPIETEIARLRSIKIRKFISLHN